MIFHDIDSYDFDALGPIRIERVATLPLSASFTSDDTGRVLYTIDTEKFYYGDSDSWVEFATYDALYAHITQTSDVHGASGSVIGEYNVQTLHNKELDEPTIESFINATHNHTTDEEGGILPIESLPTHTHASSAQGGIVSHTDLLDIGIYTHIQIDSHIDNTDLKHPVFTSAANGFTPMASGGVNDTRHFLSGDGIWRPTTWMVEHIIEDWNTLTYSVLTTANVIDPNISTIPKLVITHGYNSINEPSIAPSDVRCTTFGTSYYDGNSSLNVVIKENISTNNYGIINRYHGKSFMYYDGSSLGYVDGYITEFIPGGVSILYVRLGAVLAPTNYCSTDFLFYA